MISLSLFQLSIGPLFNVSKLIIKGFIGLIRVTESKWQGWH